MGPRSGAQAQSAMTGVRHPEQLPAKAMWAVPEQEICC